MTKGNERAIPLPTSKYFAKISSFELADGLGYPLWHLMQVERNMSMEVDRA